VCWDAETFIAPALQPFHPDIIAAGLQYRVERMKPAQDYAIENGYEGCMMPWQSGSSGHEVDLAPFANTPEQHIGGDLALLMAKHFYQTNDTYWLEEQGGEILASCIAEFYASRVVAVNHDALGAGPSSSTTYSIRGVIGPDEFATGTPRYSGVTDNPWTNLVASRSLEFGVKAQQALGKSPPASWLDIASNLHIIYDEDTGVHPEYVGFDTSKCYEYDVKQADVTLLTYPGDLTNQSSASILADLACYEEAYDEDGPAMTYAISTIDYLEADQVDQAAQWLDTTMRNQQEPYQVWTETVDPQYHPSDMGCYHFLTGAGGFMQVRFPFFFFFLRVLS
jgi:trehalose/maltose hydrolase-like predicted phosphorylase